MGCDGYILNPFERITFEVTCYECGRWIDHANPSNGHTDCIDDSGRIRVNLDRENYEPR